ncbi:transmembrane protein, putative (macronuclear) [Tetrahymena thermophila SB210]|uniref:Transmembrane protein, putative n=1 Tax=Tetrahymena thermophila (strain SB210) TaxID=312017 RepID=I7M5Y7_TETTS|nr:transmembrane protein, putative [Tetrahymena thermophila SB210]EAR83823.2 transmembrane protein, putative [Tetrahymena thermophila SB210]|eukprot:XP_001031486.2 transmembrane protein, putative [Tetrahymena thermophila SB210]
MNIKIVEDQSECSGKSMQAQGTIDYDDETFILRTISITDKNSRTRVYQICFEVYNFFSFANLAGKNNQQQDDNYCQYKGINFQPEIHSNLCPISEFFISDQNQEESYEKVEISKDSNFSLFIKRSNPHYTPAVDIKFLKENQEHLPQSDTNISFQINSFEKNQNISDKQSTPLFVKIYIENQISLDSQCYSALLFFDSYVLYSNSTLFKLIVLTGNVLLFITFLFISTVLIKEKKNLKYCVYIFQALSILDLYSFYPLHQDLSYIKTSIKDNCFLEYNPLRSIYEKANQFNNFYIFYLIFMIAIIALPFKIKISNKKSKRFHDENALIYEMAAA